MRSRTEAEWNAVYDVLVQEAGAQKGRDRERFIAWVTMNDFNEYRFMGSLGFGGKLWKRHDGSLFVNCYREDQTSETLAMCERTNARLAEL